MAHNIYNNKFASFKIPAWHKLGMVFDTPLNAVECAGKLGLPLITRESVYIDGPNGPVAIPDYVAIAGKDGQGEKVVFSIVGKDYNEITHADFVTAWDKATKSVPIETMGLLGKGETLFLSTKLPSFSVKGDELENYLLAYNPLTGKDAATARITPVRVVCQNTLNQSSVNFKDEFRVLHRSDAALHIGEWIERVYGLAAEQTQAVREAFDLLASFKVSDEQVKGVLETVYPITPMPDVQPDGKGLDILAAWETLNKKMQGHQEDVLALYSGEATGFNSDAFKGTAWGGWNSVVEYEDYGKKHRRASSMLIGAGASRKNLAFDQFLTLATQ